MPNGELSSVIFQTAPMFARTHLVLVNLSPSLEPVFQKIAKNRSGEITCITCGTDPVLSEPPDDLLSAKEVYMVSRAGYLRPFFASLLDWERRNGHLRTVIVVCSEPSSALEAVLTAELPIDLCHLFLRYRELFPTVVRIISDPAVAGGTRASLEMALSVIRQYYFNPATETPSWYHSNAFDTTVFRPGEGRFHLEWFLKKLISLQKKESAVLGPKKSVEHQGVVVMEELIKKERSVRRLDWLGVGHYPFFPRVWTEGARPLAEFLDFRKDPESEDDPWAKYKKRKRETSWDASETLGKAGITLKTAGGYDLVKDDYPYRITFQDPGSLLLACMSLARAGLYPQAISGFALIDPEALPDRILFEKWLGLSLVGIGRTHEAFGHLEKARSLVLEASRQEDFLPGPLFQEAAHFSIVMGDLNGSDKYSKRALDHNPLLPGALRTRVETLFRKGQLHEAVKDLRNLTGFIGRPDPELSRLLLSFLPKIDETDDPVLLEELAIATLMSGSKDNRELAVQAARKAFNIAPNSPEALVCLISSLVTAGKNEEVPNLLQEAKDRGITPGTGSPVARDQNEVPGRLLRFPTKKRSIWKRLFRKDD
ncbi:tetratricopeptide repeat protein [Acidobacteriota bacterium]